MLESEVEADPGEVLDMEALHDDDNGIALLVIEARQLADEKAVDRVPPLQIALSLVGAMRVVDDQPAAALAGDRAPHGGGKHLPATRVLEIGFGQLIAREAYAVTPSG